MKTTPERSESEIDVEHLFEMIEKIINDPSLEFKPHDINGVIVILNGKNMDVLAPQAILDQVNEIFKTDRFMELIHAHEIIVEIRRFVPKNAQLLRYLLDNPHSARTGIASKEGIFTKVGEKVIFTPADGISKEAVEVALGKERVKSLVQGTGFEVSVQTVNTMTQKKEKPKKALLLRQLIDKVTDSTTTLLASREGIFAAQNGIVFFTPGDGDPSHQFSQAKLSAKRPQDLLGAQGLRIETLPVDVLQEAINGLSKKLKKFPQK